MFFFLGGGGGLTEPGTLLVKVGESYETAKDASDLVEGVGTGGSAQCAKGSPGKACPVHFLATSEHITASSSGDHQHAEPELTELFVVSHKFPSGGQNPLLALPHSCHCSTGCCGAAPREHEPSGPCSAQPPRLDTSASPPKAPYCLCC